MVVAAATELAGRMSVFDPIELEFLFTETIQALRPGMKLVKTYAEACEEVAKMEAEVSKSLPASVLQTKNMITTGNSVNDNLATIQENSGESADEEEGEMERKHDEEEYDDEQRDDAYYDDEDEDDDDEGGGDDDYERQRTDSHAQQQDDSNGSEIEDNVVHKTAGRRQQHDVEDNEFVKEFESLVTENIAVK